jgi:probable phosphoglycerate mutase
VRRGRRSAPYTAPMFAPDGVELWLVRHGETESSRDGRLAGWIDVPLTERGRAQAAALHPLLAAERFDGTYASDLSRALETARLAWGEPRLDPRLREVSFGRFEGALWEELETEHRTALEGFREFALPGGESLRDVRARVLSFLAELSPGCWLLFTHGAVIRILTHDLGEDRFLPTGAVAVLDWTARRIVRLIEPQDVRREDRETRGATRET